MPSNSNQKSRTRDNNSLSGNPIPAAWACHTGTDFGGLSPIMMTSSNGNIFRVPGLCVGNSPVTDEFPTQRSVMRSFDVFFDLRVNKWLSKQAWGWWFETLSRSLWRHYNGWVSSPHHGVWWMIERKQIPVSETSVNCVSPIWRHAGRRIRPPALLAHAHGAAHTLFLPWCFLRDNDIIHTTLCGHYGVIRVTRDFHHRLRLWTLRFSSHRSIRACARGSAEPCGNPVICLYEEAVST